MNAVLVIFAVVAVAYVIYRLYDKQHSKPDKTGPVKEEPGYPPVPADDNAGDKGERNRNPR
jgi:hypothetical protein